MNVSVKLKQGKTRKTKKERKAERTQAMIWTRDDLLEELHLEHQSVLVKGQLTVPADDS